MSPWFAERKYLKFKPCTLLCALPHRQLPPRLAFTALVLTELFSRTGIKLMGTIGTPGTRRALAGFAQQHSLAPCSGWFGCCSGWGGHSRGVPPLHGLRAGKFGGHPLARGDVPGREAHMCIPGGLSGGIWPYPIKARGQIRNPPPPRGPSHARGPEPWPGPAATVIY